MLWVRRVCGIIFVSCALVSGFSISNRTLNLMSRYPLIDGHNDLALKLRMLHNNRLNQINLHAMEKVSTDINRLQDGRVGAQLFAAYVMCTAQDLDAVRLALEQIDVIQRMCTEYEALELVTTSEGLKSSKKIACLISVEGGHTIDSSLAALRMFYHLGVRSLSLTHTCNTPWAKSSSKIYPFYIKETRALTDFGMAVVEEMNRLGMIIDLSHASWDTAWAVLNVSTAPVIFSHSSAYAVCNNDRNVPDNLLHALKKNGGLIMINMYTKFVACSDNANVSDVADHFDYIKTLVGSDTLGIGGDYDGAVKFPQGLEDVSKYPTLIQELLHRKWTEHELAGVLRLNFLRVFKDVEKVRDMQRQKPPGEIEIPLQEANNSCRLILRPPGPSMRAVSKNDVNVLRPLSTLLLACLFLLYF
ncbi:dipeptidase 2 [Denticeps clupeoides]|nr:dipeptidase 2-like [Denticeps clupeoides]